LPDTIYDYDGRRVRRFDDNERLIDTAFVLVIRGKQGRDLL
jgi:hypothetical protein